MNRVSLIGLGIVLICIASCRTATGPNFPPPPPTPAGYIACAGHVNSYCVPIYSDNYPTWYAFWKEAPDSSNAVLLYSTDPSRQDSLFLIHDTSVFSGWKYRYNPPVDTSYSWARVVVTKDSVIEGSFGVDCGSYIYLKKLQ